MATRTNQSFRVCNVNLATPKVAPYGVLCFLVFFLILIFILTCFGEALGEME